MLAPSRWKQLPTALLHGGIITAPVRFVYNCCTYTFDANCRTGRYYPFLYVRN